MAEKARAAMIDKAAIRKSTVAELRAMGATNESIARFLVKCLEEATKMQDGKMKPKERPRESAEWSAAFDQLLDAYPVLPVVFPDP